MVELGLCGLGRKLWRGVRCVCLPCTCVSRDPCVSRALTLPSVPGTPCAGSRRSSANSAWPRAMIANPSLWPSSRSSLAAVITRCTPLLRAQNSCLLCVVCAPLSCIVPRAHGRGFFRSTLLGCDPPMEAHLWSVCCVVMSETKAQSCGPLRRTTFFRSSTISDVSESNSVGLRHLSLVCLLCSRVTDDHADA